MNILFSKVKKILPKISATELVALRAGGASLDTNIMLNSVNKFPFPLKKVKIDHNYIDSTTKKLFENVGTERVFQNGQLQSKLLPVVHETSAFGINVKKEFEGKELNISSQSNLLVKLASFNPSLAVSIMVPNSLGPAELIQHYGTKEQKDYYLGKLVRGDLIPCFGLTGPNNGSDALGKLDSGYVYEKDGKLFVEIDVRKRYITLAPIANLVGFAVNIKDPNNLVGKEGITLILMERVPDGRFHNPLHVGFPNGPIEGIFTLPVENVIGGSENIGNGWKMLTECLGVGRGVSLPASALGTALTCCYGITGYANVRSQFNIPLSKMQGVQEKLFNIMVQTNIINSGVKLYNDLLDNGYLSSTFSAVMKQQCTERARHVIHDSMDIFAGSGICIGPNNFLYDHYVASPIGITVEGSNTLTRSLIIFGQGLNKSHSIIGGMASALIEDNETEFSKHLKHFLKHSATLYLKNLTTLWIQKDLDKLNSSFASSVNIVSLMGGSLKKNQILSGHFADIFSNLYLMNAVQQNPNRMTSLTLKVLYNECIDSFQKIQPHLPLALRMLISTQYPRKKQIISTEEIAYGANLLWSDNGKQLRKNIEEQIVIHGVLENIKQFHDTVDINEKQRLCQQVIKVEDY